MSSMSIDRDKYPGKTDAEIAEIVAKEYGFIAIIRYKNVPESTEFTNFGTCQTEEEIQRYLETPYDPEVIYDGRGKSDEKQWLCQNCGAFFMVDAEYHYQCINSPTPMCMSCTSCGAAKSVSQDVLLGRDPWPSWLHYEGKPRNT